MTPSPNWLLVLGALYVMVAFFFLACAAIGGAATDPGATMAHRKRRSAGFVFAGIAGVVGSALQIAGQFTHLAANEALVLVALATIPLMLGYVQASDSTRGVAEGAVDQERMQSLALVGGSRRYGTAAE